MFLRITNLWARQRPLWWGVALGLLWFALWLPPLGPVLRASMSGQMLVQMGLLVFVGLALGRVLLRAYGGLAAKLAPFRWALLISATFTLALWMLPRLLDLAVEDPRIEVIKALTLTFLAGLPLCWAWQGFGPVMHGVIHVEAVATLFRLAWLYLDSPVRLCAQYRYDEQTLLGEYLIVLGSAYVIWLGVRALFGRS